MAMRVRGDLNTFYEIKCIYFFNKLTEMECIFKKQSWLQSDEKKNLFFS